VFPDDAFMQGTIRVYNQKTMDLVKAKIRLIAESTAEANGCRAEVDITELYPATVNHKTEVAHVIRVATKYFGADKVKGDELPLTASEDFSFFLEKKPGCFYMLGIQRPGERYSLHTSHYNYNDSLIGSGGLLFVALVQDRLNASIL